MLTIKLFIESIQDNKSPESISGYHYDLIHFERYLKKRTEIKENYELNNLFEEQKLLKNLNQADIIAYVRYLANIKQNKKNTINRKISVLKKYFQYLYDNQIIEKDITRQLKSYKVKKNESNVLSLNQCNFLLNSISGKNKPRDQLIILLFLLCGLNVNELITIEKSSIYDNYIIINEGSENLRKAYINDALRSILSVFLKDGCVLACKYLFSGKDGGHISKRTVQHIIKTHLIKTDFYQKGKTTELLRNTCFSLLSIYCELNITEIKNYLGYKTDNENGLFYYESSNRVNMRSLNKIRIALKE